MCSYKDMVTSPSPTSLIQVLQQKWSPKMTLTLANGVGKMKNRLPAECQHHREANMAIPECEKLASKGQLKSRPELLFKPCLFLP